MIGLFDSGHGGLTIYKSLSTRFEKISFVYLGDHANAPYGNRPSQEIVEFTRTGVETLFLRGCRLVILACNTATAIAARKLQQDWLPASQWKDRNLLGVIAPTVEAATQTPWAVNTPQYPQKYNDDLIALFATDRTIRSNVYIEEIHKRCPKVSIIQQSCHDLAGAIELGAPENQLNELVGRYVASVLNRSGGHIPHRAILGCTHYPLVEHLFRKHLPPSTRLLSQPDIVADSLEDYLSRHPRYLSDEAPKAVDFLTTGNAASVTDALTSLWNTELTFRALD